MYIHSTGATLCKLQDGKRLKEAVGKMCKKYLSATLSDKGSSGGGGGGASLAALSRDGGGGGRPTTTMSGLVAEFSEDDGGGMGRSDSVKFNKFVKAKFTFLYF